VPSCEGDGVFSNPSFPYRTGTLADAPSSDGVKREKARLDLWQHHQHGTMAVEIARGKRYFPGWNVARWWLSHESFQRGPERFLADFDAGLVCFCLP